MCTSTIGNVEKSSANPSSLGFPTAYLTVPLDVSYDFQWVECRDAQIWLDSLRIPDVSFQIYDNTKSYYSHNEGHASPKSSELIV